MHRPDDDIASRNKLVVSKAPETLQLKLTINALCGACGRCLMFGQFCTCVGVQTTVAPCLGYTLSGAYRMCNESGFNLEASCCVRNRATRARLRCTCKMTEACSPGMVIPCHLLYFTLRADDLQMVFCRRQERLSHEAHAAQRSPRSGQGRVTICRVLMVWKTAAQLASGASICARVMHTPRCDDAWAQVTCTTRRLLVARSCCR